MRILIIRNCYTCSNRPRCCEYGPNRVGCNGNNIAYKAMK